MNLSGTLLTLASLVAGWIILWPLRGHLGARGYHLAAYPLGLLVWPMVFSARTYLDRDTRLSLMAAGIVAVAFALAWGVRSLGGKQDIARVPLWSFAAWGGLVVGLATVVGVTGITSWGFDSVFHFERWGYWLWATGRLHEEIMYAYGAFIPSVHAVNRYFGGDWTSTLYPVLSLHVMSIFAVAVYEWAAPRVSARATWAITVGTLLLMVTAPRYVHHTLYVHGHMFTAAYLMLALYALQRAYLRQGSLAEKDSGGSRLSWLVVAGAASAGLALGRADGIAYLFVPFIIATLIWWEGRFPKRDQMVFVATAALPVAAVYLSAFSALGFWEGRKLDGSRAALVLGALSVGAVATLALDLLGPVTRWLRRGRNAMVLVLVFEALALAALVALSPESFAVATRNMVTNLFVTGGNGQLWYFLAGTVAISLLYGGQWREGRLPSYLLFAIVQFFFAAVLVHGLSHIGRLSPNDSFNRVSFHVVPVIFWYVATVITAVVQDLTRTTEKATPR
jgi:hypothetical protein